LLGQGRPTFLSQEQKHQGGSRIFGRNTKRYWLELPTAQSLILSCKLSGGLSSPKQQTTQARQQQQESAWFWDGHIGQCRELNVIKELFVWGRSDGTRRKPLSGFFTVSLRDKRSRNTLPLLGLLRLDERPGRRGASRTFTHVAGLRLRSRVLESQPIYRNCVYISTAYNQSAIDT
jgi:hypothetical protein